MAHGTVDWANRRPLEIVYSLDDHAELAARLKALSRYHRGGKQIFWDDFGDGLGRWTVSESPPDTTVTLVDNPISLGPKACKLEVPVGNGGYCAITKTIPIPVSDFIALEWDLLYYVNGQYNTITFRRYTTQGYYEFGILLNQVNNKIQYYNHTGVWTDFLTPMTDYIAATYWSNFKLCVSGKGDSYNWLYLNGVKYDMSALKAKFYASPLPPQVSVIFRYDVNGAALAQSFVGLCLVTVEEV